MVPKIDQEFQNQYRTEVIGNIMEFNQMKNKEALDNPLFERELLEPKLHERISYIG